MHPLALIIGLAAIVTGASAYKRYRDRPAGSQTNASDAVDNIHVPSNPTHDDLLDAGVQETFPASDPVSVSQPSETAYEKQQRRKRLA